MIESATKAPRGHISCHLCVANSGSRRVQGWACCTRGDHPLAIVTHHACAFTHREIAPCAGGLVPGFVAVPVAFVLVEELLDSLHIPEAIS